MTIPISKRNINSYIITMKLHQNLNKLLAIPNERISHLWWLLHASKPKKNIWNVYPCRLPLLEFSFYGSPLIQANKKMTKDVNDHSHYEKLSQHTVRIYGLKQKGGELFKRGFRKPFQVQ